MHRFLFRFMKRRDREGQGLVEYALILVLVAIVVIAVLTLFGDSVANAYCGIIYELDKNAKPPKICHSPMLVCTVQNADPAHFTMHVKVIDPDAADPTRVVRVEFFNGGSTPLVTETGREYCFPQGDSNPCENSVSNNSKGVTVAHVKGKTITALAYDSDGHTGKCSVSVP